jgi:hypothetical protein
VLLEPDVHHVLWDEFVKTPELIAAGEAAARAALPKIQALLAGEVPDWRRVLDRRASRGNKRF